jgi:hypothetical protein
MAFAGWTIFLVGLGAMLLGGGSIIVPLRFAKITSRKMGLVVFFAGFVVIAIGASLIPGLELEPDAEEVAEVGETPTEPDPSEAEPGPLDTADVLRQAVADALGSSNRERERLNSVEYDGSQVTVMWAINDNLTQGFIKGGAKRDVVDILQTVAMSEMPFDAVTLRGTFPLVDEYGNSTETEVVRATYTRATVDRINWEGFIWENVYRIADDVQQHPTFR